MRQNENHKALPIVWQPTDRRAGKRLQVDSKPVCVDRAGIAAPASCENISDRGMRLRFTSSLDISDAVVVIFQDDASISGRVVWQRDGHCGITFDRPIDSSVFLYDIAGLESGPLALASAAGLPMLRPPDSRFREGLHVRVALASGEERRGVITWGADDRASLELLDR